MLQFTLHSTDQTVGQQLLGIRYGQVRGVDSGQWISGRQKAHLALLYIACPWLRERLAKILRLLHLSSWEQQVSLTPLRHLPLAPETAGQNPQAAASVIVGTAGECIPQLGNNG